MTRLAENAFLAVSGAAVTHRDLDWLRRNIDPDSHCFVTDVTTQWAVLGIMGPRSRELLQPLLGIDLSTEVVSVWRFENGGSRFCTGASRPCVVRR